MKIKKATHATEVSILLKLEEGICQKIKTRRRLNKFFEEEHPTTQHSF